MLLGAHPKEYRPSKQELLLDATGERIKSVCKGKDFGNLKKSLREKGIWGMEINYTHFTFIHYDVMGSGRFFYVNTMTDQIFQLSNENK